MRRRTTCLVLGVTNSSWLSILEKESTKPLELLNSLTNDELGLTDGENGVVNAGRSLDEHAGRFGLISILPFTDFPLHVEEIIVNQTTGVSQDYRGQWPRALAVCPRSCDLFADISFVPEQQHTPLSALGLYNSGHCIDAEDETSEDPAPTERSESPAFTFVNLTTANYAPMLELESFWDSDSDSLHSESGSFDEDGFADAFEAEAANAEVHRLPGEDTSSMQTLGQGTTTFSDGDIAALGEPDEDSVISLDGEGRHSRETSATSNDDGFLVLASPTLEEAPAQQNAASLEDLHDYEGAVLPLVLCVCADHALPSVFDHVVDEDSAADSNESVIPDVGSAMNDSTYPHEPQITATVRLLIDRIARTPRR
jgi:hypothetical protein